MHTNRPTITTVTRNGSTRQWRNTRADFATAIDTAPADQPIRCRRCNGPLRPGEPFDLGHIIDSALGGTDDPSNLWPEHPSANRSAGARLGNHLRMRPLAEIAP